MRISLSRAMGCALAAVSLGCALLHAEDPGLTCDLKLRTGYALSLPEALGRSNYGFGLNLNVPLSKGILFGELGYHWKGGRTYRANFEAPAPGQNPVNTDRSADVRHGRLSGVAARLGWAQPFAPDFSWQAGLMLGGTQYRDEVIGSAISYDYGHATPGAGDYLDTYTASPTKGSIVPSPFVGIQWHLDESGSLELNLVLLSYRSVHYVHIPGGNGPTPAHNDFPLDHVTTSRKSSMHLEIGYAFHF